LCGESLEDQAACLDGFFVHFGLSIRRDDRGSKVHLDFLDFLLRFALEDSGVALAESDAFDRIIPALLSFLLLLDLARGEVVPQLRRSSFLSCRLRTCGEIVLEGVACFRNLLLFFPKALEEWSRLSDL